MVHTFVSWFEFGSHHKVIFAQIHGQDKILEDVGAISGNFEGSGHFENQVGFSELPACWIVWSFGPIRFGSFCSTGSGPLFEELFLMIRQTPFPQKMANIFRRTPRGHQSRLNHAIDLSGSFTDILIREKWKGGDFSLAMTTGAVRVNDRCDVSIEGDRILTVGQFLGFIKTADRF